MKNNWKEELREQIYQVGLMGMRYMKDDCKKEDCLIIQKELLEKVESLLAEQKKELTEGKLVQYVKEQGHDWELKSLPDIMQKMYDNGRNAGLAEQKKELIEEALAREKLLVDVHRVELDSISCMSLERFIKWSDDRKNKESLKHHD